MPDNKEIRLLPADPSMAGELLAYCLRNRSFLAPFEPKRTEEYFTEEHQRKLLESDDEAAKKDISYHFYIYIKGRMIGMIGINGVARGPFQSAFLGYKLDGAYLNRGFMTAAVGEAVRYAFDELNLHRLEANVMPRNKASLRVLEKNGFTNEGTASEYLNINGVWEDHIHMVKLNRSWKENK